MTSLYEITNDYRELLNMDLDAETLADTLESIDAEFDDKADNICHVIANIDSDCDALDGEIKRLQDRKKSAANRKDGLKTYLRESMERLEKKKIATTKFTINCVAGRDMATVLNENDLPRGFFEPLPQVFKLDKASLLESLKAGPVTGAELGKTKSSLRIK